MASHWNLFESWFSEAVENATTATTCFLLQCLGIPALAEGDTMRLGPEPLHVGALCYGLRVYLAMLAVVMTLAFLTRRAVWEKFMLLISVAPIVLLANASGVVVAALLQQFGWQAAATRFSWDVVGVVALLVAALLVGVVCWSCRRLFREVSVVSVGTLLRP
jgi:exosortase/archaeosortase family protein